MLAFKRLCENCLSQTFPFYIMFCKFSFFLMYSSFFIKHRSPKIIINIKRVQLTIAKQLLDRLILLSLWFQMISKTIMMVVSVVVSNCLTLALPQAANNPKIEEDNMVDSCKCVLYYQCRNETSAPDEYGEGSIDIKLVFLLLYYNTPDWLADTNV